MLSRYKELDLDDVGSGVELGRDVLDPRGAVLFRKGTQLTESMLRSLNRRGIEWIWVLDETVSDEALRAEREQIERRLEGLFRDCRGNAAAEKLYELIVAYRLQELK